MRRSLGVAGAALGLVIAAAGLAAAVTATAWAGAGAPAPQGQLRIFFVDVEGGQATLFVTPSGHSLLIDTGWPGNNGRDAERIVKVAKSAGLSRIDAVLITHFHTDHVGGVPQLAERFPIGMFLDHGPNREFNDAPTVAGWNAYQKLLATGKYQHRTMHPGETLPGWDGHDGPKATVMSADGVMLDHALPGGGEPNHYCGASDDHRPSDVPAVDPTENARSLGIDIDWGKLRILDLGDLTWDKERQLVCPTNKIGHVNLLIVSHHGFEQSSSPAMIDAIAPQVAIMDNGATKGGTPRVLDVVREAPSKPDLWQLHFSEAGGSQHNTQADRIANGVGSGADAANILTALVSPDGHMQITNQRTGASKSYSAK